MPSPLLEPTLLRRIALSLGRFGLYWGVLVLAWPLFAPLFRPLYCAVGNLALDHGQARASFEVTEKIDGDHDVDITLRKAGTKVTAKMYTSSRLSGYLPLISFVAFCLATPVPWKRRQKALLWGLVFIALFILLRMWVPIRRDFSNPNELQVYDPGALMRWWVGILERAFVNAPASWFIVPIFVWVGTAFQRSDWELLDGGTSGAEGRSGGPSGGDPGHP